MTLREFDEKILHGPVGTTVALLWGSLLVYGLFHAETAMPYLFFPLLFFAATIVVFTDKLHWRGEDEACGALLFGGLMTAFVTLAALISFCS